MKYKMNTTAMILLSFLLVILTGAVLLALPCSSATGIPIPIIDALFMSTTSVCVTGLVTLPTFTTWSTFGHIVILFLIQIGGLGAIILIANMIMLTNKRLNLRHKVLLKDALNIDSMFDISHVIKRIVLGTFLIEGLGALSYMTVFIPQYGLVGIWYSIFNSISAFCNAGIDIIAPDSLCQYATNPIVNWTTMALIVIGGIGFIVWFDIGELFRNFKTMKLRAFNVMDLHTKIALTTTFWLIFGGAFLILLFDFNNPGTFGNMNFFEKVQAAIFQSVTCRTAGFITVPQENLTNGSALVCILLMFIGGSPVGTAGGIKSVTFAVIMINAFSIIKSEDSMSVYHRRIDPSYLSKAIAIAFFSMFVSIGSGLLLSATMDASLLDVLYETFSATATVGVSRNLTASLNSAGKIIIIMAMYFGRVGPISMATLFYSRKESKNCILNPTEKIVVG